MKTTMEAQIRTRGRLPAGPSDPAAFWRDFERQADGLVRETPRRAVLLPGAARWAAAAAGLLLLAGGIFLTPARLPPAAPDAVRSLAVLTAHDSVFIMNDAAGEGTIVWIGGIPPNPSNGG